jgi:hypothetical protein
MRPFNTILSKLLALSLNKKTYGAAHKKMVQRSTRRHQEEKLVRNWEEKILGTKRLETFCSLA